METHLSLKEYHALGRASDPKDSVLSASTLLAGFNPNPRSGAHPAATLAAITGEPSAPTFDMMAGTFLHLLLLDGLEPVPVDPKVATWTAKGLGKGGNLEREVSIEGTCRLGSYLIGPPAVLPSNHLAGGEQRRALLQLSGELDLELAGCPSGPLDTEQITAARRAFDEALATAGWLSGGLKGPWPSNYFSEHLPPSAANAYHLLCEAPGEVEQVYRARWDEIDIRARPDKTLEDATILDLKRVDRRFLTPPDRFWHVADERGYWTQLGYYEMVMWATGNNDLDARPWKIVAVSPATKTTPPAAFTYPCGSARQAKAREQVRGMMARYAECLESDRWETAEEQEAEQTDPWVEIGDTVYEEADDVL